MKKTLIGYSVALSLVVGLAQSVAQAEWSYTPESIAHWHEQEGASLCAIGKTQSPIAIKTQGIAKAQQAAPKFSYRATQAELLNTGKSIQVNIPAASNHLRFNGKDYALLQFHLHTPSEEAIDGKHAALVAHFVHKNSDGELLVVAQLFDVGKANLPLRPMFNAMNSSMQAQPIELNLPQIFSANATYFAFKGSLTTPPCSEGVQWLVIKQKQSISAQQLKSFTQLYAHNARPVQAINGRAIELIE